MIQLKYELCKRYLLNNRDLSGGPSDFFAWQTSQLAHLTSLPTV
jgi:hypothetical protein